MRSRIRRIRPLPTGPWLITLLLFSLTVAPAPGWAQFPHASFTETAVTVNESDGSVALTVVIDAPGNNGGILYQSFDESAIAGDDYESVFGFLSWDAGDSSPKTITVTILADGVPEEPETFRVELTNGDGVDPGDPSVVTVTIEEGAGGLGASFVFDEGVIPNPDGVFWVPAPGGSDLPVRLRLDVFPQSPVTVEYLVGDDPTPVSVTFDGEVEKTVLIPSPPRPAQGPIAIEEVRITSVGKQRPPEADSSLWNAGFAWLVGDSEGCAVCAVNLLLSYFGFAECFLPCAAGFDSPCPGKAAFQGTPPELLTRYRDEILSTTVGGSYYVDLYEQISPQITDTILRSPSLLFDLLQARGGWLDAIAALVDGNGDAAIISTSMQSDLVAIVDRLIALGDPGFAQTLQEEADRLDLSSLAGLTMTQFQHRVEQTGAGVATGGTSWGRLKARFDE